MSSSSSSSGETPQKPEQPESLSEIRARALRESAERRKQKQEEAATPPPTQQPQIQPAPSQPQFAVQQPQQQQQQVSPQQAFQMGFEKSSREHYAQGFIVACLACGGLFLAYKGVCMMWPTPAPVAARARQAAAIAQ